MKRMVLALLVLAACLLCGCTGSMSSGVEELLRAPQLAGPQSSVLQRGMPFEMKLPAARPLDVSTMTDEQFNAELEKGFADIAAGRTRPAKQVFDDIRRDYGV